jgi:hypothetical protein
MSYSKVLLAVDSKVVVWCAGCTIEDHSNLLHLSDRTVHILTNLEYLEWRYEKSKVA